mmetsp:Transcript_8515/g.16859  ORF Transcript_8515/g.16859 Transcript_8515/m.16859 type:complete len:186 (-) Transcript_8515:86-643(-)
MIAATTIAVTTGTATATTATAETDIDFDLRRGASLVLVAAPLGQACFAKAGLLSPAARAPCISATKRDHRALLSGERARPKWLVLVAFPVSSTAPTTLLFIGAILPHRSSTCRPLAQPATHPRAGNCSETTPSRWACTKALQARADDRTVTTVFRGECAFRASFPPGRCQVCCCGVHSFYSDWRF